MLICGDCSSRNKDGESFCSNCGAYLVWQKEPVEAGETPPADKPRPDSPSGPTVTTVKIPTIPLPPDPSPDHAPERGFDAGRHNPMPGAPQGKRTVPGVREEFPSVITAQERTDSRVIGVDGLDTAKAGPVEVKPGYRKSRAPDGALPRHDETAPAPGELICGRCGAGNNRERKFCRRCAASLDEAAVVPRPPWWRRFLTRPAKAPLPAGTRPKRKRWRFPFRLVSFLAMLSLVAGAFYLFRDPVIDVATRVQDNLLSTDIRDEGGLSATASSEAPGRGAARAIDTYHDTSWAAGSPGNTSDQYLMVSFGSNFRLTYIYFTRGSSDNERHPVRMEIRTIGEEGEATFNEFEIEGVRKKQGFHIGADRVSAVKITILTSMGPADAPVAIAEVQFLVR